MLAPTAQPMASVRYPMPAAPYCLERRGNDWVPNDYAVTLSENYPEHSIRTPIFSSPGWVSDPGEDWLVELLDWEFTADTDPRSDMGTISVTLRSLDGNASDFEGTLD